MHSDHLPDCARRLREDGVIYKLDGQAVPVQLGPRHWEDRMRARRLSAGLALALLASSASASEGTTYLYDVQGRVTAVTVARTSGVSTYIRYSYDNADNRTVRETVTVPIRAVANELRPGEMIVPQQPIFSTDGRFQLVLQKEGNLVLYFGSTPLWATPGPTTAIGQSMVLSMQSDGNLVIYTPDNTALWASGTAANAGAFLRVQNDGNVVIRVGSTPIWATNTCCH